MFRQKMILFGYISLFLSGCAEHSIRVTPDIPSLNMISNSIECKIVYDESNSEYLPPVLKNNANSSLNAYYQYTVQYVNGSTNWDGLNLWNPLIMVGFPMSEESVIVEGKLEFKEQEKIVQQFSASCIAVKTRNLFQTGGSSGPRKSCLLAIRDNINSQLNNFKIGVIRE